MPGNAAGAWSSDSLASLNDVTRTIAVTESFAGYSEANIFNAADIFKGHLGTVNFLFCDGHVKAMKPTATGTPVNMWNIEENIDDGHATLMESLNAWQTKVDAG